MNILNIPSFSGILLRSIWSSLKPLGANGLLLHTYLIIWDLSLMWTWSRKEGQQEPFKPLRHSWLSFPLIRMLLNIFVSDMVIQAQRTTWYRQKRCLIICLFLCNIKCIPYLTLSFVRFKEQAEPLEVQSHFYSCILTSWNWDDPDHI